MYNIIVYEFQSTLPARGATDYVRRETIELVISIHAPRTGSDQNPADNSASASISIHAPRTGSDA